MAATDPHKLSLTASYASPSSEPFAVAHELQAPPSGTANPTVPDKTRYLGDLRRAAAAMQEQINRELTRRMDEDKAREAARNGKTPRGVDEAKEEENYGEEVPEEED